MPLTLWLAMRVLLRGKARCVSGVASSRPDARSIVVSLLLEIIWR